MVQSDYFELRESIYNFKVDLDLKCHWNDKLHDFQLVHHFRWIEQVGVNQSQESICSIFLHHFFMSEQKTEHKN